MLHRPPPDTRDGPDRHLAGRVRAARWVLAWEAFWPQAIIPVGLAGLFVALALFDILPALPGWLHALILCAFATALAFTGWRAAWAFRLPPDSAALRRLERDNQLSDRPLGTLADQLAAGGDDPVAQGLWQLHRRRMAERARDLRVAWPESGMARRDPWGIRAAVVLLLVIAATYGGHDAWTRLDRALSPHITAPGLTPDFIEVWITPPAYTGAAPILLKPGEGAQTPTAMPAGSTVLAVVEGGWGTASLDIDGVETPFQQQDGGQQRVETHVESGGTLAIEQAGIEVARWPIKVLADALPSIEFQRPPETGDRGRLHVELRASDDYGLAKAWMLMRRIEAPDGEATVLDLPLPATQPRQGRISAWLDLTAHPWAGLPVTLAPVAQDGLGQEGAGELVTVTLPERSFTHPVARILVQQRRMLSESRDNASGTIAVLDAIATAPDSIGHDLPVFLALRLARHELGHRDFDLPEIQDLLWNSALRLEDGQLARAERDLEDIRAQLDKALAEEASNAEIEALLAEFEQALARYLDALAEQMAESGMTPRQPLPGEQVVTDDQLAQMLDSMRDLNDTGARDALRRMLQSMDQLLSGLQSAAPMNGEAAQAMRDLQDLNRRQQDLMDETFRQSQQPDSAEGNNTAAAQAQDDLRRTLDEVAKQLGDSLGSTPQSLGQASQAMQDATQALRRGDQGQAAESQGQALQSLQQAMRDTMDQMAGSGGMGLVPRDPMGRPLADFGIGDDGSTRIPAQSEIQRARQILNELRRRAGDRNRPEPERDYLDRLLKQF